jgi:hypothetical protein
MSIVASPRMASAEVDSTAAGIGHRGGDRQARPDEPRRHRRRVEAGLRVREGERRSQERTDGAEQVDEIPSAAWSM